MNRLTGRIAIAALVATALSASTASAATPDATGRRAPSQALVARTLALRVTRARTPAARYKALLGVMRTLHMGVFTGKGKAIVRAGRPHDVYLYDFEIQQLAGALERKQTNSLAELAADLSAGGLRPHGEPLTAEQLAGTLRSGTSAARKRPRDRLSLVPLLARELGLRHRPAYDLATAATDSVRLDAFQTFLVGADVAAAAYRRDGGASSLASASAAGRDPSATAAGVCDGDGKDLIKEFMPFGKWTIGLIKVVGTPVKGVAITLDAIHGPLLAFSVDVVGAVGPNGSSTHYGPAGHDAAAGKPLDFRVYVVMRDQVREGVIKCGPLVGVKFPDKGPIPGVAVIWQDAASTPVAMDSFGTTSYPKGLKTDEHGISELHFVPKNEQLPAFGSVYRAGNAKTAVALYQSAFGNLPGTLAQFLTPKSAKFDWSVSFHLPRGFKFAGMIHDNDRLQFGKPSGREDVDMHVCGDDPYAPWTGVRTWVSEGDPIPEDDTWAFVPGVPTSPIVNYNGYAQRTLDGQLNLTPPFSAVFTWRPFPDAPREGTNSLPLVEDQSCPENAPPGASR